MPDNKLPNNQLSHKKLSCNKFTTCQARDGRQRPALSPRRSAAQLPGRNCETIEG
jgi:hypothetical protein